jgi:hypothetical protein
MDAFHRYAPDLVRLESSKRQAGGGRSNRFDVSCHVASSVSPAKHHGGFTGSFIQGKQRIQFLMFKLENSMRDIKISSEKFPAE